MTVSLADPFQPPSHSTAKAEKKVDQPATANLITLFMYCYGTPEVLGQRIAARKNHFMSANMLESQLQTLQDPRGEDGVAWVDIDASREEVEANALRNMKELVARDVDGKD